MEKNLIALAIVTSASLITTQNIMARPSSSDGYQNDSQQGNAIHNYLNRRGGDHGKNIDVSPADILSRMDENDDGIVTIDDFIEKSMLRSDKQFNRLDSDGDTYLSSDEMENRGRRHGNEDSELDEDALRQCVSETTGINLDDKPTAEEVFEQTDTDDDGYLSLEEFQNTKVVKSQERFSEIDTDEDGTISEDEITVHMEQRQLIKEARQSCQQEQVLTDII